MITKMLRFLKRKPAPKERRMYDLRKCFWSHSVVFVGEGKIPMSQQVHGWLTPYVKKGDMFLFPATKGLAVWVMIEVENCKDPRDMFFATVGIIRYATKKDIAKAEKS